MGDRVWLTFKRSWRAISECCTLVTLAGIILWLCGVPIPDIPVVGGWLVSVVDAHRWILWVAGIFMGAALHASITGPHGRWIRAALWSRANRARMALSTVYSFLVRNVVEPIRPGAAGLVTIRYGFRMRELTKITEHPVEASSPPRKLARPEWKLGLWGPVIGWKDVRAREGVAVLIDLPQTHWVSGGLVIEVPDEWMLTIAKVGGIGLSVQWDDGYYLDRHRYESEELRNDRLWLGLHRDSREPPYLELNGTPFRPGSTRFSVTAHKEAADAPLDRKPHFRWRDGWPTGEPACGSEPSADEAIPTVQPRPRSQALLSEEDLHLAMSAPDQTHRRPDGSALRFLPARIRAG